MKASSGRDICFFVLSFLFLHLLLLVKAQPINDDVEDEKNLARFIPATDPSITYIGRVLRDRAENSVSFDWPCVSIETNFYGASLNISMNGGNNEFIIFLDGRELGRLLTTDSSQVNIIYYLKSHYILYF